MSFAAASYGANEEQTAQVIVHRNGGSDSAVTVNWEILCASGTLSWADGDADPKWIEYSISDDGSSEPRESFDLTLSNVSGGAIGTYPVLSIDIVDGTGANRAPNSIAGPAQTVAAGNWVILNGSQSNDPDGDSLSYSWTQTLGAAVALGNADSAIASFTAPRVSSDTLLRFELTVMDSGGLTDTSTVAVTVSRAAVPAQTSGGGPLSLLLLVALAAAALQRGLSRTDAS